MLSLGNVINCISKNEYIDIEWPQKGYSTREKCEELKTWRYIFGYAMSDFFVTHMYSDTEYATESHIVICVTR